MPRDFLAALALALATSLPATTRAQAPDPDGAPPPPPAFQPVLYRPWVPGEPLPEPSGAAEAPRASLVPGPEYARLPYQFDVGVATLPFECLASEHACGSTAQFASLGWRGFPHFAWTLALERTDLRAGDRYYVALGARVFAYEKGALDPFLELNLGGEVATEAAGVALAGEVVFGLGVHLLDHLMLSPVVKLRHSEHGVGVCRSSLEACDPWTHERTYWIALGLAVGGTWGPPE